MPDKSLEARWGDDMLDAGFGVIPYLILDALPHLGVTAEESLFIIHVHRFKRDERNPYPSVKTLARNMCKSPRTIQNYMSSLECRGFMERIFRPNKPSELDFSGLLKAVREFWGVKNPAPPATSRTPGVNGSAPPPVQGPASRIRKSSKARDEKEGKEPVLQPPVQTPKSSAGKVSGQVKSPEDEEDRFLSSLKNAEEVLGIADVRIHWQAANGPEAPDLPAKTAAYWLFAYPKGCWNYLDKHGPEKAVRLIEKAIEIAIQKHRQGKVKDLIGYLNEGIQGMNPYLIHE